MNNEIIKAAILNQKQVFVEEVNKDIEFLCNEEERNDEMINKLIFIEYFAKTIEDCLEINNYKLAMKRLTMLTILMDNNQHFKTYVHKV
ncbi:hypothetical protein AN640_03260 [Candidatus Epulonipiscium fishelsonii]|uniref:Uncharacterized protein n=1 Tax=Candidatus Epulonipiscium fishelsonii TaxID=77094 RepID=A0ACC8XJ70_9FIRM|nr:hypothetical protein AN640_03260 [Epulopiscium sp. SCG-D08WGA-EpuloA1]